MQKILLDGGRLQSKGGVASHQTVGMRGERSFMSFKEVTANEDFFSIGKGTKRQS
jgi:hypothetical protein